MVRQSSRMATTNKRPKTVRFASQTAYQSPHATPHPPPEQPTRTRATTTVTDFRRRIVTTRTRPLRRSIHSIARPQTCPVRTTRTISPIRVCSTRPPLKAPLVRPEQSTATKTRPVLILEFIRTILTIQTVAAFTTTEKTRK
jgi:hypothetical protein